MDASVRSMVRAPRANPKNKAGLLSRLFFIWLFEILKNGYKDKIEECDIPEAMPDHKSELLANSLQETWGYEIKTSHEKNRSPSFARALFAEFGLKYMVVSFFSFVKDLISLLLFPYMLRILLLYFTPSSNLSSSDALLLASALVLINFCNGLANIQFNLFTQEFGVRIRAACITMVYRKSLKLSQTALGCASTGQIINLVSNDVARFEMFCFTLLPLMSVPVIAVFVTYSTYLLIGPAALVGVTFLFMNLIIQLMNCNLIAKYRLKIAKRTDERVRLMDEIVMGIQVIKMYAWEKPFRGFIDYIRKLELDALGKASYMRGIFMTCNLLPSRGGVLCTLLTLLLCGQSPETSSIFVLIVYFTQLAMNSTVVAARGYQEFSEIRVSISRIENFLLQDEFKPVECKEPLHAPQSTVVERELQPISLLLSRVSAKWTTTGNMTLKELNIDIRAGQLVAVIGQIGSGKSSLLHLLLGELTKTEGTMEVNGVVSYAAQEPWIFSSSVRQNILFREDYNSTRYKMVCKVCELERDFEILPRGDKTLVGEKGTSLSGGQKARINLARAIYKKADIYLLDDPLSAVDSHVGKHLFYRCIEEFLSDKTRILVTHQLQHLYKVNHLILMEDGHIQMQGTFKELRRSHFNFATALQTPEQEKGPFQFLNVEQTLQRNNQRKSTRSEKSLSFAGDEILEYEEFENDREAEEPSKMGTLEVYRQYLSAGISRTYCLLVISLFLITQILISAFDYWLAFWLQKEQNKDLSDASSSDWDSFFYIAVLGAIFLGILVFGVARVLMYYHGCIRCSKGIHSQMVQSLIDSPLQFFNNNPTGRILNRFSRDLGATDELLSKLGLDVAQALCQVIGALVISVYVNQFLAIPIAVLTCIMLLMRKIIIRASLNVKRVEGIVRSPVYSHLNASLQGLVTIRALSAESLLQYEHCRYLDIHTSTMHIFYQIMACFQLVQEIVATTFFGFCIFTFILIKNPDSPNTNAALVITQSLSVMLYLGWVVKLSSEAASHMICTERALEYTLLESEDPDKDKKIIPQPSWPKYGMIEMRNVYLRYDISEPYVLRNLNLTVFSSEKIGIVGRTGAGKSSLIAALFRLTPVEGTVSIDAVDTGIISLESLRSRISIIPQDPVLFSGTLRINLDPYQQYSDAELYSALKEVKLVESSKDLELMHLNSQVSEGGSNFSVGQRQLVCLARAILRNNKVLICDEVTANVDPQTDALVQSTIRHRFRHCTVLTVAHRLNTIIDSDRVLVMDAGTVAEFDHPHTLLGNRESLFYRLVQQTGSTMTQQLTILAKESYMKRQKQP